jgi:hypothetical protein
MPSPCRLLPQISYENPLLEDELALIRVMYHIIWLASLAPTELNPPGSFRVSSDNLSVSLYLLGLLHISLRVFPRNRLDSSSRETYPLQSLHLLNN